MSWKSEAKRSLGTTWSFQVGRKAGFTRSWWSSRYWTQLRLWVLGRGFRPLDFFPRIVEEGQIHQPDEGIKFLPSKPQPLKYGLQRVEIESSIPHFQLQGFPWNLRWLEDEVGHIVVSPIRIGHPLFPGQLMKKVQPDDEIVKVDKELGIVWIKLPPDKALGGFRGISPRIMDEEKFLSLKKRRKGK